MSEVQGFENDTIETTEVGSTTEPNAGAGVETDSTNSSAPAPVTDTPADVADAVAYAASYKYKVDGAEKEFDDFIRPVIKDADTEKKIREMYEKAHGLDRIKQSYDKAKTGFNEYKGKYDNVTKSIGQLEGYLKGGDLDNFFGSIGLNHETLFKYVKSKLDEQELPQEHRQALEERSQLKRQQQLMHEQFEQSQAMIEQMNVKQRTFELDQALGQNSDVVSQIDSKLKSLPTPSSIKNEVIQYGLSQFHLTGQDIPVEDALNAVLAKYRPFLSQQAPSQALTPVQAITQQRGKTQTIPNVHGKSTSPMKKTITSIDDLNRIFNEKFGS